MVSVFLKVLSGLLMIAIGIIKFTSFWGTPYGPTVICILAFAAALCLIVGEVFAYKSQKTRDDRAEERHAQIVALLQAEIANPKEPSESLPAVLEAKVSSTDPQIYLDINFSPDDLRTPIIVRNAGGSTAHDITINSLHLKGHEISFKTIPSLFVGESDETLPTVEGAGPMLLHNLLYWLNKDWDANARMIEAEWPIPIVVHYTDALRTKQFRATMTLVFFPIVGIMNERRENKRKAWEFRDIKFSLD